MARTALRETEPLDIEAVARTHVVLSAIAEALSVGIEKARVHEEQRLPYWDLELAGGINSRTGDLQPAWIGRAGIPTRTLPHGLEYRTIGETDIFEKFESVNRIVVVLEQDRHAVCGTHA